MSFRRPPSDVESMVSLRVDNLPYRTHPEVSYISSGQLINYILLGFEASV